MTKEEKELIRHAEYLKSVKEAKTINELPKRITNSLISSTLISASKNNITKETAKKIADKLMSNMEYIIGSDFKNDLLIELEKNGSLSKEQIESLASEIQINRRLFNLTSENNLWNSRFNELNYIQITNKHEERMRKINNSFELEELPKVGISSVNKQLALILYDLFNKEQLKVDLTGKISKLLLEGLDIDDIKVKLSIKDLCEKKHMIEPYDSMSMDEKIEYVSDVLRSDYVLDYVVKEVMAKEKRILYIYRIEHEDIMEQIESATRIRELPSNISLSKITSYLSSNSMIVPKGKTISSAYFVPIANLLLKGAKLSDDNVKSLLAKIVVKEYEDEDVRFPFDLLYKKLSSLPRLDYFVEEVRRINERQQEFITRGSSNVNVYMIPNDHSPVVGGKFYNIYISSAVDLNLEEILPVNLDEIIPPNMDTDAIEWYVRNHEKGDKTFKAAGGIILNKDESIGSVNVFKPADGKLGITPEEKTRYEKIEDLSRRLKEVTAKSKAANEAFIKSQKSLDEEITAIESAMTLLLTPKKDKTDN